MDNLNRGLVLHGKHQVTGWGLPDGIWNVLGTPMTLPGALDQASRSYIGDKLARELCKAGAERIRELEAELGIPWKSPRDTYEGR